MNGQPEIEVDYKKKYKNQKRKLKFLVYEQECFQEELRRAQRKLLKVSRDKSFLLDRLLQYENVDDDSSDSEATASSDNSDGEGQRATENPGVKKRRSSPHLSSVPPHSDTISLLPSAGYNALQSGTSGSYLSTLHFPPEYLAPPADKDRKEKKNKTNKHRKPQLAKVVPTPPTSAAVSFPVAAPPMPPRPFTSVPRQMLSGDAPEEESDGESDREEERGEGEEAELVIDIPNE
ncbi:INO80 complex subunit E isoform X1 [Polypterus senegalus]|uniref:INO80 complex subunit E isoform X1 n=1 Tax=Polypterus senegalus TaxID=55291 RepID=UPI001962DDB6|nr:INO80 complex subunit E isoform X1 [Polypterus senegalus]